VFLESARERAHQHEHILDELSGDPDSQVGPGLRVEHPLQGRTPILVYLHGRSLSRRLARRATTKAFDAHLYNL